MIDGGSGGNLGAAFFQALGVAFLARRFAQSSGEERPRPGTQKPMEGESSSMPTATAQTP